MVKVTKKVLRVREKRKLKREAKELWIKLRQEVISEQGNRCYLCGKKISKKKNKIDVHHIIDRRNKKLMYNKLNLVGLCKRCHRLSPLAVHQTAIYFSEILRTKEPERYSYLLERLK
jgi:5-methylcytosine-specific restriction endonuclease McrA